MELVHEFRIKSFRTNLRVVSIPYLLIQSSIQEVSILALWGNKNWPPIMKVKKLEMFRNKMSLMGCKWSSLNTPGTEFLLWQPNLP